MPTELTGAAIWRATITAPASGDARSAASVATMGQDLADSIAYLNAQDASNYAALLAADAALQSDIDLLETESAALGDSISVIQDYLTGATPGFEISSIFDDGSVSSPAYTVSASATTRVRTWQPSGLNASRRAGDLYVVSFDIDLAMASTQTTNVWSNSHVVVDNNAGMPTFKAYCGTNIGTNSGTRISCTQSLTYSGLPSSSPVQFYFDVTNGFGSANLLVIALRANVLRINKFAP